MDSGWIVIAIFASPFVYMIAAFIFKRREKHRNSGFSDNGNPNLRNVNYDSSDSGGFGDGGGGD